MMRPPSLRSCAKVIAVVLLFAIVRYFPDVSSVREEIISQHQPGRNRRNDVDEEAARAAVFRDPELLAAAEGIRIVDESLNRDPDMRAHDDRENRRHEHHSRHVPEGRLHNMHEEQHSLVPDGFFPISLSPHPTDNHFMVHFCRLRFDKYHENPSELSMFKNLVAASDCNQDSTISRSFAELKSIPLTKKPDGLVFHQSRVGSSLTANLLGSDISNLVFSESAPPANCVLHCNGCSDIRRVELLRVIVNLMGTSSVHTRLFLKLQSVQTASIDIYVKAFPTVPWIFLFRDPVEIMVSHLGDDAKAAPKAPCMRSKRNPTSKILSMLSTDISAVSNSEYCAAHLNWLARNVIQQLHTPSAGTQTRGLAVNYKDIPGKLIDEIFPKHFRYDVNPAVREKMLTQAKHYSKGMGRLGSHEFEGDAEKKHQIASKLTEHWAQVLLQPSYDELSKYEGVPAFDKNNDNLGDTNVERDGREVNANAQDMFVGGETRSEKYARMMQERLQDSPDAVHMGFEEEEKEYLPFPELMPLVDLLKRWPPDDVNIPDVPGIRDGTLEHLDYRIPEQKRRADILRYNEVPFIVTHHPMIDEVVDKWTDDYLINTFGSVKKKITYSKTNHFMYFNHRRAVSARDYTPPTSMVDLTFKEWLDKTKEAEHTSINDPHYYFQTGSRAPHEWIARDLYDFGKKKNFFIVDPSGNRGINCRFGAKHIIAEGHYDGGRNFIAMLKGAKRYVLLPPSECKDIYLYPKTHPEGRHVMSDWSALNITEYPKTKNARATEVVLSAGQVLYLPSYWFHYIMSLGMSAQCNTRSGAAIRGRQAVTDCGFY